MKRMGLGSDGSKPSGSRSKCESGYGFFPSFFRYGSPVRLFSPTL